MLLDSRPFLNAVGIENIIKIDRSKMVLLQVPFWSDMKILAPFCIYNKISYKSS